MDNEEQETWKSCCLRTDPNAVIFFSQLTIALITIGFCIYQLSVSESCERDSMYSGILSLVIGCYLPTPSIKRK